MASPFFYFIPNANYMEFEAGNGPKILAAAGLDYLGLRTVSTDKNSTDSEAIAVHLTQASPLGNTPGVAIFPIKPIPSKSIAFERERQSWRSANGGKYWIGYDTNNVPNPAALMRDMAVQGYEYRDNNEDVWIVPVICAKQTTLPAEIIFDETTGEPIEKPSERLQYLVDIGLELAKHWLTEEFALSLPQLCERTIRILQYHYRVSRVEFNELRAAGNPVFNQTFAQLVGQFAIGSELLDELQKKTTTENSTDQTGQ